MIAEVPRLRPPPQNSNGDHFSRTIRRERRVEQDPGDSTSQARRRARLCSGRQPSSTRLSARSLASAIHRSTSLMLESMSPTAGDGGPLRYAPQIAWLSLAAVTSSSPLAFAAATPQVQQIEIAHAGCFHGKEVSAQTGEVWAVLYRRGDHFELVSRTIQVNPCHDAIFDRVDNAAASGRSISVDIDGESLLLVRGLKKTGPTPISIRSAQSPDSLGRDMALARRGRFLAPGQHVTFSLGRAAYRLTARGGFDPSRPDHDRLIVGYRLTLKGPDGVSQDLAVPTRFAEDGVPVVVWAGDLDGDGKLDLYMDLTDHYNVRDYALYLSSRARAGMLVKKVATRRYVGC